MRRRRDSYYDTHRKSIDKDALNELFRDLRKQGLVARQNFSCCGSCAGYEIATWYGEQLEKGQGLKVKGCVFYHRQDGERLDRDGGTYLAYGEITHHDSKTKQEHTTPLSTERVGQMIREACERLNIKYEWDGSPGQRFWVDLTEPLRAPPPPPPSYLADGI